MTNECFMTIRFKDEVVRRHFLNDIPDQGNIECDENPIYEDVVFFAFPDQPYFDTSMPDNYWNFLTLNRANQGHFEIYEICQPPITIKNAFRHRRSRS